MRRPILDELRKAIEKSNKKDSTKKAYISRVNTLEKAQAFPFKGKDELDALIRELNPSNNVSSQYNIVAQFLSYAKLLPAFGKMLGKPNIARLRVQFEQIGEQKKESQSKARDSDISWSKVQEIDPSHAANRTDRLIWALYTRLSAVPRNDFVDVKLVDSEEDMGDDTSINYYLRDKKQFLINEHKTSSRYGALELTVPSEVATFIPKDQEWLFENSNGDPMKENTVNKRVNRALQKVSGKPDMTIITLRRSYAAHMKETMSEDERIAASHAMGHSGSTNKRYGAQT